MKKFSRSTNFSIMGFVALIIYLMIRSSADAPDTLKLALATLAFFLFLMAMAGYLKRPNPRK